MYLDSHMTMQHCIWIVVTVTVLFLQSPGVDGQRSFSIDYEHDTFVKDGQPFRYISGSIHYSRVHPAYWQDRLSKMRAAGLNAIQIYVPWNLHEPVPGKFNFEGIADLTQFLTLANNTGLLVIARVGPYICAEWEMGGLPSWLLRLNHSIALRTSDPIYLEAVDNWMNVLLPKISPFLYKNGGPIITVQIENEYGSYYACDYGYMRHLYNLFHTNLGDDVVFFTTDGAGENLLKCGALQNVYATVDFGAGGDPSKPFAVQKKYEPKGPSVNSEYYTGWLDHWGQKHETVDKVTVAKTLDEMLSLNASVNMYMFEGGTNFGFWNGANMKYNPQPTSYDYDAPLSEAGDPTDKFMALRDVIAKYTTLPPDPVPPATPKNAYGTVTMQKKMSFYDALDTIAPYEPIRATYPITMEDMQQSYGYILYRMTLTINQTSPVVLSVPGIRDRGYVMVNQNPVGIVERLGPNSLSITCQENDTLDILVENMGRINYGMGINDSKGLIDNVTLDGTILQPWLIYSLDLDRITPNSPWKWLPRRQVAGLFQETPTFYLVNLPDILDPQDTYLKIPAKYWTKGQAYLNGFNLGRYWPAKGPQITLYVPAPILKASPATNTLVLFEVEFATCGDPATRCMVEFIDRPIINATIPGRHSLISESYLGENESYNDLLHFMIENMWAIFFILITSPSLLWVIF